MVITMKRRRRRRTTTTTMTTETMLSTGWNIQMLIQITKIDPTAKR